MSAATPTRNGHLPAGLPPVGLGGEAPATQLAALAARFELPRAFTDVVLRYLALVLPAARAEHARWSERAAAIPDPELRRTAHESLAKRGNIEGAALFAVLAPAAHRPSAIRALVAFQTAYNFLDALSEQPSEKPAGNADQLHQALLTALHLHAEHDDYYAYNPSHADGGYLCTIVDACRDALAELPSFPAAAVTARVAAARIVDFQTLNLAERDGGHAALRSWSSDATPRRSGLEWWETAAASGSSLSVHALIAAAATPDLDPLDARAIDAVYFPWAGALHSLLDSLVDRHEDRRGGRACLLDHYGSTTFAAVRLDTLAGRTLRAADALDRPAHHRVIVTAMCSYYLSAPQCDTAEAQTIHRALARALGLPLAVAVAMFRGRRLAHTLRGRSYS
jgi:tetraprenyl-beta-curcumene synthase